MEEDQKEDTAGIGVKKTRAEEEEEERKMWIRKQPDADGYFLLQLAKEIEYNDMFLTAKDASSLKIERK